MLNLGEVQETLIFLVNLNFVNLHFLSAGTISI